MSDVTGYRRLLNNASVALGGRMVAIVVSATVATILFRVLGPQRYGQWSLLTLLAGYSTLIDFGLSSAVERRVARLVATSAEDLIPPTLNTSLTALFGIVAVAQVAVFVLLALPSMASVEPGTRRALLALPICSGLTLASLSAGAVLAGQQRMLALHGWRTAGLVGGSAAVVAAVIMGTTHLDVLLLLYTAGSVLTFGLVWSSIRRSVPALRLRVQWDRATVRDLFWFGGVIQIATMVPPLAEYAFRLMISARFGVAYSGVYDLAARAAIFPRSLAGSLFSTMIPFAVQVDGRLGKAGIRPLVRSTVRHASLFILPTTAILVTFSHPLVQLWLGQGELQAEVRQSFEFLLIAHALGSVAVPAAMVGRALGRPAPEAVFTSVAFVSAVVLSRFVASPAMATALLWGLPAAGGFACWMVLNRRVGLGFVHPFDAVSTLAATAVTLAAARALLPASDASPIAVLVRLAMAGLVAVVASALIELVVRKRRIAGAVPLSENRTG